MQTTLEKIHAILWENLRDTKVFDSAVKVLEQFEGKAPNIRLEKAIVAQLRKDCEGQGVAYVKTLWWGLELNVWATYYEHRVILKLSGNPNKSQSKVDMAWIKEKNPYWFGMVQTDNTTIRENLAVDSHIEELADVIDEYHRFVGFMKEHFDKGTLAKYKSQILKVCGIDGNHI